ncbi:hypothetical protein [Dactylosporangium sp. CA-233914]
MHELLLAALRGANWSSGIRARSAWWASNRPVGASTTRAQGA